MKLKREAHITILTRSDKQSDEPKITMLTGLKRMGKSSARY